MPLDLVMLYLPDQLILDGRGQFDHCSKLITDISNVAIQYLADLLQCLLVFVEFPHYQLLQL